MQNNYEKPMAEIIDFSIRDRIMDAADYSEGTGTGGENSGQFPEDN